MNFLIHIDSKLCLFTLNKVTTLDNSKDFLAVTNLLPT